METQKWTRRFYDRMRNPPGMVDEEVPTKTVHIFAREKYGDDLDGGGVAAGAEFKFGSVHFTGSHYDLAPGSYSLRIIRRSVYIGSIMSDRNTQAQWGLWHSREGTIDAIPFFLGIQAANRRAGDWKSEAFGGPLNPLYSVGPGTVVSIITAKRGTIQAFSSLEGIFS